MGVTRVLLLRHPYLLRHVRHASEATFEAHLQNEVDQGHSIKIDLMEDKG